MQQFLNQYSYVFAAVGAILGAVLLLLALRVRRAVIGLAVVGLVAVAVGGWLLLRPGASDVNSLAEAEAAINSGKPTLVEFFSNYCAGCLAARDAVTALVEEMHDRFGSSVNVLRVDIHTHFGRALRERYGFSYTPEFVMFDAGGVEIWRSHVPPSLTDIELLVAAARRDEAG